MAIIDAIPGVRSVRDVMAALAGVVMAAVVIIVIYEGVPLGPLRHIPLIGPGLEYVFDGRVDRVARRATKDLVTAGELEAAEAEAEAQRKLRIDAENRAAALLKRTKDISAANAAFAKRLAEADILTQNLRDEIDDILSSPVNDRCVVDDALLDRLRNR